MEPLISIIVPAYNIEPYISRCLDSILSQTYQNIEIVVVNDGSSDKTGEIIDQYSKNYPEKIIGIHKENDGVSKARIDGITASHGSWIGFVDGDDMIASDMYARLMKNALEYNADISHCGYQTIVNDGERIHKFYDTGRIVKQDNSAGIRDLIEGSFVEPALWNKIYKRSLVEQLLDNKDWDRSLKINEDVVMNYVLFGYSQCSIYEDFCPYYYLTRSTSASRSEFKPHKLLDPVKARKWILDNSLQEFKDICWKRYLMACMNAYHGLYNNKNVIKDAKNLKTILKTNKDKWYLLGKKERSKLKLILTAPHFYSLIYNFYSKNFQKKQYE
ncbi:MAG: glycosyltransferase [Clostridia bacterium]|nr:glycosyltransferase [Clostridia bacterium]